MLSFYVQRIANEMDSSNRKQRELKSNTLLDVSDLALAKEFKHLLTFDICKEDDLWKVYVYCTAYDKPVLMTQLSSDCSITLQDLQHLLNNN